MSPKIIILTVQLITLFVSHFQVNLLLHRNTMLKHNYCN